MAAPNDPDSPHLSRYYFVLAKRKDGPSGTQFGSPRERNGRVTGFYDQGGAYHKRVGTTRIPCDFGQHPDMPVAVCQ